MVHGRGVCKEVMVCAIRRFDGVHYLGSGERLMHILGVVGVYVQCKVVGGV